MPKPTPTPAEQEVSLRTHWRFDVSDALPVPGKFEIASTLILPVTQHENPATTLLVCLPGGFLSRHYFDLQINGSTTYSFAEAMTRAGYAVLCLDHIGTGESSFPEPVENGYTIGVPAIARANRLALESALQRLREGDPTSNITPCEFGRTIGVGHSMGSMLAVEEQAFSKQHEALLLFSFSTQGTPRFLDDSMRAYAGDPERLRKDIGKLAENSMGTPYPERATNSESDRRAAFGVGTAPSDAEDALHAASTNLLATGGLTSMIPGGFAPPAAEIDVPVMMIFGDHDLHDDRHTREELPRSPSVTTYCLEDAWHCHFVSNNRETLWLRVSDWINSL